MRILRKKINAEMRLLDVSIFIFLILGVSHFLELFNFEIHVVLIHLGLFFFGSAFIYKKNLKETLKEIGFFIGIEKILIYSIIGLFSLILFSIIISFIFNFGGVHDGDKIIEKAREFTPLIIFAALFIGPLSEEIFFRAFLTNKIGIVGSSIAFAAAHFAYGSWLEIIGAFGIGILLAYLFKKAKSIIPCILIHFTYNLISLAMVWWVY